jgi:hypothetical protein
MGAAPANSPHDTNAGRINATAARLVIAGPQS